MGLTIRLETESGSRIQEVDDAKNLLHELLPQEDDTSFQCLRFVDWYGDTVFNQLQLPVLIAELQRTRERVETADEREIIDRLLHLVDKGRSAGRLYVRFIGD